MAELSIIVPIYNVEKYLSRCIESILEQTYTDFELILINDGSPDNCAEIMERYAKKDNRIVIIHQNNRGVSAARNAGLRLATGKYVGFVDPDDWIDKQMYQILIEKIQDTNSDIACCNWSIVYETGEIEEHKAEKVEAIMPQEKFAAHVFDSPRTVGGSVWNKLFLRKNIVDFFDETLKICEDNLFLVKYCLGIKRACYTKQSFYYIFARSGSATRKGNESMILGLPVREDLVELVRTNWGGVVPAAERDYLDSCYFCYNKLKTDSDLKFCHVAEGYLKSYMKKNLWSVLKNKEIYWKTRMIYLLKLLL